MIFGKLFGGREQDDEPTASAPPPVRRTAQAPSPRPAASPPTGAAPTAPNLEVEDSPQSAPGGKNESRGFDPYNSGVFNKSRAWERINRR